MPEHDVAGSARAWVATRVFPEALQGQHRRTFAVEHPRSRRIGCIRRWVAVGTPSSRAHRDNRDLHLWKGVVVSVLSTSNACLPALLVPRTIAPEGIEDAPPACARGRWWRSGGRACGRFPLPTAAAAAPQDPDNGLGAPRPLVRAPNALTPTRLW